MNKGIIEAIDLIEKERKIDRELLFTAIEEALKKAYRNHFGIEGDVRAEVDRETGAFKVIARKTVVEDDFEEYNDTMYMKLSEAKKYGDFNVGDIIEINSTPKAFGRIAAQTAKQVVLQRIKEAERESVFDEFSDKVNEIMTAIVQRSENGNVYVELGRTEGLLPISEQVEGEKFSPGERIKVYILKVDREVKGKDIPIILSRKNKELIKRLFELEVPEVVDGIVQIKAIAREPGIRSKVAVYSTDPQVDAVGSCVGPKGSRIERIVQELRGEKIDVIPWSPDPIEFIANSLSAAKVIMVQINENEKAAKVIVPDNQLSLAIGMKGINAKLAAKLTGWKIDIKSQSQAIGLYQELAEQGSMKSNNDDMHDNIDNADLI